MTTTSTLAPDGPEFYDGWVLTITGAGGRLHVHRNGEMRIIVGSGDDYEVVRTTGGLRDIGVNNDYDLANLLAREDVEVVNNPWFAVYDDDGNEVYIEHSLQAAVGEACRYVA